MAELHKKEVLQERALVVGLSGVYKNADEAQASLDELGELVEAAGGLLVRSLMQMRQTPEASTFLGKGKLEEIKALAEMHDCNLLVVDTELKGSQLRNIAEYTGLKVLDRSLLILDIFAKRAISAEGKLQVELAQLQQRLSRLTGMGQVLSRLGGGIGTRGPGESQLESDRRHIRRRIEHLQEELATVEKRRLAVRKRRSQDGAKVVCVVGYTNAGKSSLLNRLCDAGLWEMDQVFATLDPAARRLVLENGGEIVLIDTVGFIRRLPTALIEAFKSSLEVVLSADLLLHVSDISDPDARDKEAVVLGILEELGAEEIPSMHLLNKIDLLPNSGFELSATERVPAFWRNERDASGYLKVLPLSLKTGEGLQDLRMALQEWFEAQDERYEIVFPYSEARLVAQIYRDGRIMERRDEEEGIFLKFTLPSDCSAGLRAFLAKRERSFCQPSEA